MNKGETIKQIENCVNDGYCYECEHKTHMACKHFLLSDALVLLKEQPEIIKCRDCKRHYNELKCRCGGYTPDDFYCAEGERKDS